MNDEDRKNIKALRDHFGIGIVYCMRAYRDCNKDFEKTKKYLEESKLSVIDLLNKKSFILKSYENGRGD